MPTYEYECQCGHITTEVRIISDRNKVASCRKCGGKAKKIISAFGTRMDHEDHRDENSGRGRYYSQLGDRPNDPQAWCRTRQEARDKAHKRGFHVENVH